MHAYRIRYDVLLDNLLDKYISKNTLVNECSRIHYLLQN